MGIYCSFSGSMVQCLRSPISQKAKKRYSTSGIAPKSGTVPFRTVYITLAPPGPIFHGRYLHSSINSSVGAKELGFGNISPRAFRRLIVSVMASYISVVEQSSAENRSRGV